MGHVTAPELLWVRRRKLEPRDTWQLRNGPMLGGGSWHYETCGSTLAASSQDSRAGATGHVGACKRTSYPSSWLRACTWGIWSVAYRQQVRLPHQFLVSYQYCNPAHEPLWLELHHGENRKVIVVVLLSISPPPHRKVSSEYEMCCGVGLAKLVRFLVMEVTQLGLNPKFDMCVIFMANYSYSGRRRPRRQWGVLSDRLYESKDQIGSVFQMCS
jgi:hypothetical protein